VTSTTAESPDPTPPAPAIPAPETPAERFAEKQPGPHPLTRPHIWGGLLALLFVMNIPFFHYFLRGPAKVTTTVPFHDDFSRKELGENYFATGGQWRILNDRLYSPGVKNNPLWLRAKLPRDVVVEVDVMSDSTAGDVKCEIFGNGRDHSSGYVMVFGGWNNTISALARLDEHGLDRKHREDKKVEKGRWYHWKIVREGRALSWYIDNELFLQYDDPQPLEGPDHDRFGMGTWQTDAYFDNLTVQPLHH